MEQILSLPRDYERVAKVTGLLSTVRDPALSSYGLAKLLYMHGAISKAKSAKKEFEQILETVLALHLLTASGIPGTYTLFGKGAAEPREVICALDPFCYVSHLSAMEYHGLTDRFSKILYMTRPSAANWKEQAEEKMRKDLDGELAQYRSYGLPTLTRHKFNEISGTLVQFQERSQLGAFRLVANSSLRVATIGRVFLDMLREPALCGGVQHVIDVFKSDARRYLKLIVDEIERHGQPIDKVRAGFVLSEVCKLSHPMWLEWEKFAQRGGSRKLDPAGEFSSSFSERWMLSINVPSALSMEEG
ncbi:MAG: hypothetical protein K2X55_13005 [Burkholderiaceae bacterium]|nr:hypothetical protein [Burkholderiaceae bacterium]